MRLILEDDFRQRYTVEVDVYPDKGLDIWTFLEGLVRPLMRAAGYFESSIIDVLGEVDERGIQNIVTNGSVCRP